MLEWIAQWYVYVPALPKVSATVAPGAAWPASQLPSSSVTVWVVESLLVQATTSPTFAWIGSGENLKSLIVAATVPVPDDLAHATAAEDAAGADAAGVDAAGVDAAGVDAAGADAAG